MGALRVCMILSFCFITEIADASMIETSRLLENIDPDTLPSKTVDDVEKKNYKILGDILISENDLSGRAFSGRRWTNGRVIYEFSSNVTDENKERFKRATQLWEQGTKLKFISRTAEKDYVLVADMPPDGKVAGQSVVGMPRGVGHMLLSDWGQGTLVHEIGHMIGKAHEHQRSDARDFLDIHLENTDGSDGVKYNLIPLATRNHTEFDFYSAVIYWTDAFSENGKATIVLKEQFSKYQNIIGKSSSPSTKDIQDVNEEYK